MRGFRHTGGPHGGGGQGSSSFGIPPTSTVVPAPTVKTGSFTSPTKSGSQTISGIGFMPKAIIFFSDSANVTGFRTPVNAWIGFAAASGGSSPAQGADTITAGGGYQCTVEQSDLAIYSNHYTTPNYFLKGTVTSFYNDGFVINWSTVYSAPLIINYIAIGGSAVQANVVKWTSNAATGHQSVTGVGFEPTVVLHMGVLSDASVGGITGRGFGIGAMSASSQWLAEVNQYASAGIINAESSAQLTTGCFGVSGYNSSSLDFKAAYYSMDADGFTVNWSAVLASTPVTLHSLCISIATAAVGVFTKVASAGAQTQDIATGLTTISGMLFVTDSAAASSGMQSQACLSISADDTDGGKAAWLTMTKSGLSAIYQKGCDPNLCIAIVNTATQVITDSAVFSSTVGGTYTIYWNAGTSNAWQICYVAFGS